MQEMLERFVGSEAVEEMMFPILSMLNVPAEPCRSFKVFVTHKSLDLATYMSTCSWDLELDSSLTLSSRLLPGRSGSTLEHMS